MHENDLTPNGSEREKEENDDTESLEGVVEDTPPEELARVIRALTIEKSEMHIGPLPHPNILKQYNDIVPGSAEKIIGQFTAQGDHRRYLERSVIESNITRANWGLVAGSALGVIGLIGSFYVIVNGYSLVGLGTFVAALTTLVYALRYAREQRKEELKRKAEAVPEERTEK